MKQASEWQVQTLLLDVFASVCSSDLVSVLFKDWRWILGVFTQISNLVLVLSKGWRCS